MPTRHPLVSVLLCLALSGCYASLHGNQSVSGGTTTTTTSSQASATARFSGGRASFSAGQPVSRAAPGGHVGLSRGGTAIVAVGLVVAEAMHYLGAFFRPHLQPAPPAESIADTCSCYKKEVISDR